MKKRLLNCIVEYISKSIVILLFVFTAQSVFAGTLSCSVTTKSSCDSASGTVIYRMSGNTNAHAELASEETNNYNNNVVCCTGVDGLSSSCVAPYAIALKLNKTTNAHSQINSQSGYTNNACISVPTGGSISVGYVTNPNTCTGSGYDTTLGSISADTNAHVGNTTAYATKICATASAGLPASATLTSSVFDTISTGAAFNSIMWKGTAGTGKVRFQLATSNCTNGSSNYPACSPSGWNFVGSNGTSCGNVFWYETLGPNKPVELKCSPAYHNNQRYYRYKVQLCSNASSSDCSMGGTDLVSPVISNIIVNWSP